VAALSAAVDTLIIIPNDRLLMSECAAGWVAHGCVALMAAGSSLQRSPPAPARSTLPRRGHTLCVCVCVCVCVCARAPRVAAITPSHTHTPRPTPPPHPHPPDTHVHTQR
jgi:hypothetical protein